MVGKKSSLANSYLREKGRILRKGKEEIRNDVRQLEKELFSTYIL